MRAADVDYAIRQYEDADEPGVLELLRAAMGPGPGGDRSSEFFRWKHLKNPFGLSLMLVAVERGRIIGLRAFMRWRFQTGDRVISAVRPVDTATHPDAQGRGVFSRLTKEGISSLERSTALLFNTPNEKSLPGYLKMGWRTVGSIPISVKVRRPVRFLARFRSARSAGERPAEPRPEVRAETAGAVLSDEPAIQGLLAATPVPEARLSTSRSLDYLRWRYAAAPLLDYRAIRRDEDGEPAGLAIFRVRHRGRLWETTIVEVLVRDGDRGVGSRLLRDVARAASTDVQTCHLSPGSPVKGAARRAGFLPTPLGMTFVVHALDHDIRPDPTELSSWAFSLGDLEVF